MIQGYCIGGGANLAVCCDMRICSENARFAIPAAKLGLGYGYTRVRRLLDVVSPAFAKEIFFTARQFTAEEARDHGPRQPGRAAGRAREPYVPTTPARSPTTRR